MHRLLEIPRASREAVAVRFSRHAKNEMRLYKIMVADDDPDFVITTSRTTDMRADYDSKANAISITLAPAEHAERADTVHERAVVALHDGHPVELQVGRRSPLR
jgi:hypothetical protein